MWDTATGATGFLGRVLVRQPLGAGHEVAALVREPARPATSASPARFRTPGRRAAPHVTCLGDSSKARRELWFDPRTLENGFREVLPTMLEGLRALRA